MAIRGYPIGAARVMFWEFVPSGTYAGLATGQQSSLSNGAVSGAYVSGDVKRVPWSLVPPADLEIQGGDRIVATPSFGGGKVSPFDVTISAEDTTLIALVTGVSINVANTSFHKFGRNANRISPKSLGFAMQQRFEGSDGLQYFRTIVFPRTTVTTNDSGAEFRGQTDQVVRVAPVNGTKSYTAETYGSTGLNFGFENDTADHYELISSNPLHIVTQRSDGAATTFNTIYKPLSTVITLNATPNEMVKNGTPTALSSLTLAGLATLAAAGTAGDYHVLTYETNFVPV